MKYRRFGKLDWNGSVLGFGVMRLPTIGADQGNIDELKAIEMLRYAIDNGVNYVDTAYPYHNGQSEVFLGKALKDGYRERVKLATKMPCWLVKTTEDFDKYFNEQLERLQTTHIDFYLLHSLGKDTWSRMLDLNVFEWADHKVKEGKINYLGFSFHDEYEVFEKILEYSDKFTFCQIQLNYMDSEYQAGVKGMKLASEKGLALVVMEPIKGGNLAVTPPKVVQDIWAKAVKKRKPAEWALQWVWNNPEVSVVLSGMSEMRHVEENIEYACRSGPGSLANKEIALIEEAKQAYLNLGFVGCTRCRYCMPCPQGVSIPAILSLFNEYYMSGRSDAIKQKYEEQISLEEHSSNCVSCGLCEEHCPQALPIRHLMREASTIFRNPDNNW